MVVNIAANIKLPKTHIFPISLNFGSVAIIVNTENKCKLQCGSNKSLLSVKISIVNLFQVDSILRANEINYDFNEGSVKSYDSNQLASNNPIEDTRSEAKCMLTTGKTKTYTTK